LPFGSGNISAGMVRMRIGDPIPTTGLTLHDRVRVTEELRSRIAELKDEQKSFRLV